MEKSLITPEDNKKRAWDLVRKASAMLRPLTDGAPDSGDTIRPQLTEGLALIEEYLRIAHSLPDCYDASFISMNVMNLSFFLRNVSKEEFQYSVDRLNEWKNAGYENCNDALARILTSELCKDRPDRRLDLTDREYVEIIVGCNATMGCGLSKMLNNSAVKEYYIKKTTEGEYRYAFTLGTYYYETKDYSAAFNILKDLKDNHSAKYLGLMYYYGRGTMKNHVFARDYLSKYYEAYWCAEDEVIWALGDLYGRYENKRKQFEMYIKSLESPYRNDDNPFIKKMLKQCLLYKRQNCVRDRILLTVEIRSKNPECEFSLDLAPYSHLTIDWGDNSCERYGDLDKAGTEICRHIYMQPGTYSISIESLWGKVVEGLDFSLNKRQLHWIHLGDCPGLKKLSIVGQCLTTLDLTPDGYQKFFLKGVICRDNMLTELDLRHCPNVTHLDCSFNHLTVITLPKHSAMSIVSIPDSVVNKQEVDESLRLNRGGCCSLINYDTLTDLDLRLEHYFRRTNWEKVRKYIRKNERDYYDHQLAECELTFGKLKKLSQQVNPNPYEEKGGFLELYDSYINDDTILHHEEFFISEESWTTCLATKVRDTHRREPWMGIPATPPEYYVANCLVNMLMSWRELNAM